jgi:hypothetical protein
VIVIGFAIIGSIWLLGYRLQQSEKRAAVATLKKEE